MSDHGAGTTPTTEQITQEVAQRLQENDGSVDVIGAMRSLGLSDQTIGEILVADGAEESEVSGFLAGFNPVPNIAAPGGGGGGGTALILNTHCIGTCRSITIHIDISVKRQ